MATWQQVTQLNVDRGLRIVRAEDPQQPDGTPAKDFEGLESLGGTLVGTILRDLLRAQLPFRVKVRSAVQGSVRGVPLPAHNFIHLPPIEISPLELQGVTNWDEFEEALIDTFQWKV